MNETCTWSLDRLADYLEGLLPAPTVAAIEGHLAGCDRRRAFLASYQATPRIIREATDTALAPGLQASLFEWLRKQRGGTAN